MCQFIQLFIDHFPLYTTIFFGDAKYFIDIVLTKHKLYAMPKTEANKV